MTIQRQDPGAVPGHSTIEIHTREFHCDGPEDGEHPRVYYVMDDTNEKVCMYCNQKYVYVGGGNRID
tara:strand:+ start:3233 stop:3433 length:201 start_codon:yes stop_codon:yes gene_type:complete